MIYVAFRFETLDNAFNNYPGARIDDIHVFNGSGSVSEGTNIQSTRMARSAHCEQKLRQIDAAMRARNKVGLIEVPSLPLPKKEHKPRRQR